MPIHQHQFLVLSNDQNQIYLERRPPTGLWGGLWCLPSLEQENCPLDFIRNEYNLAGENPQLLITFKHRFSHFHLEINALSIKTQVIGNKLNEVKGHWFSQDELSALGLAKPTSKILALI